MVLVIGEILFDVFDNEKRLGGAPFNYAYHLKHLGIPVRFITRIGSDPLGREILNRLQLAGFRLEDVQVDEQRATGTVQVDLSDADHPQFDITPDAAYDAVRFVPEAHAPLAGNAEMVYFGSLIQRGPDGHRTVQEILDHMRPETIGFYDVNLRPASYTETVVTRSLSKTHVLKVNDVEWDTIKEMLGFVGSDDAFAEHLMHVYSINTIALTQGASGSRLIRPGGSHATEPARVEHFVDAVGAGDAYAAMLTAGLLHQWPADTILKRATGFAAQICQIQGAIPDGASFYTPYRNIMPNGGSHAE